MVSFLSRLVTVLNKEDKDWKKKCVWLLDGASYHRCPRVKQLLRNLGVMFIISSPYSYDTAPIELLFAYYKRGD